MRLSQKDMESLFLSALAHDVGMLHIDEHLLNKKEALTPEEQRQIYAHPLIGEKILSNIPGITLATTKAVREHHEKCDGTGYPSGRFESEISQQGHILALADTVVVVLDKMLKQGKSFYNVIPIIQINQKSYTPSVYGAFMTAVTKVEISEKSTLKDETIGSFVEAMLSKMKMLKVKLDIFDQAISELGFTHENRKLHSLQTLFMQTKFSVNGAGVLDEGYENVLATVINNCDQSAYREVEDASAMVDEVEFQVKRILRMLGELHEFDNKLGVVVKERFKQVIEELSEIDGSLISIKS